MPLYDFKCSRCGSCIEVMTGFQESRSAELVCIRCGGAMSVGLVQKINLIGAADLDLAAPETPPKALKSCGHKHHCRCSINLNRPNPFANELSEANGGDEEGNNQL